MSWLAMKSLKLYWKNGMEMFGHVRERKQHFTENWVFLQKNALDLAELMRRSEVSSELK